MVPLQGIPFDDFYEHEPIAEAATIRLIQLEPSPDLEADVHCTIIHKRLEYYQNDLLDHFTALSYVWGDTAKTRVIFINEKRLQITASLHCALRHLRDANRSSVIWADGICIDQTSVDERNSQVAMMGLIYSSAHHTIIFLGASSCEGEETMQHIANQDPKEQLGISHLGRLETQILAQSWFTRVWTLQELVLSRDPWVQTGKVRVRWGSFCSHVLSCAPDSKYFQCVFDLDAIKHEHEIIIYSSSRNLAASLPEPIDFFVNILQRRRGTGVSDPRDMIYGHLGLIPQATLNIDYSKSVIQVYEEVTRQVILKMQHLGILEVIEKMLPERRRPGLPSWVPDWTIPRPSTQDFTSPLYCKRNLDKNMFSIPHVLTVRGISHGAIKVTLTYADDMPHGRSLGGLVAWAMKPTSLPAVQTICTFFREMCELCQFPIREDGRKIFYPKLQLIGDSFGSDKDGLELLRILMSDFYTSSRQASSIKDKAPPRHGDTFFLRLEPSILLFNLLTAINSSKAYPGLVIVLLDTGRVASILQREERVGDLFCHLGSHGFGDTILRPRKGKNATEQQPIGLVREEGRELDNGTGYETISASLISHGPTNHLFQYLIGWEDTLSQVGLSSQQEAIFAIE